MHLWIAFAPHQFPTVVPVYEFLVCSSCMQRAFPGFPPSNSLLVMKLLIKFPSREKVCWLRVYYCVFANCCLYVFISSLEQSDPNP